MTYDLFLNLLLFTARVGTLALTLVLSFNLIADWRTNVQKETNGLRATRIALISIILALLIENTLYGIGYIHAGFNTAKLNAWITQAKPILIVARYLIFYGVLRLFLLFCCHRKDK
jgi:hypothetical protein